MAEENKEKIQPEDVENANINDSTDTIVEESAKSAGESDNKDVAEEVEADDALAGKDATDKSKKFGKKEKKKDPKDIIIEELMDKNKRQMAEFDNFRKRTEKEKSAMYEIGAKSIIESVLPVVDNFERGFVSITDEEKASPFVEGMERVFKQLATALEEAGVKPIEATGKEFDPNFHNAVMHVDDEELGDNIVAEEFQKGYMYRDTVVRHSMVKVAN